MPLPPISSNPQPTLFATLEPNRGRPTTAPTVIPDAVPAIPSVGSGDLPMTRGPRPQVNRDGVAARGRMRTATDSVGGFFGRMFSSGGSGRS